MRKPEERRALGLVWRGMQSLYQNKSVSGSIPLELAKLHKGRVWLVNFNCCMSQVVQLIDPANKDKRTK